MKHSMRKIRFHSAILLILIITGCATYRTNTELEFDSTNVGQMDLDFLILEEDLANTPYTVILPIEAIVKKATIFDKNPTKGQVDLVLFQKAAEIGANAVINVKYTAGVGLDTWGYMQAIGTAIRIESDPSKEDIETGVDQAAIPFMGIAAEEISSKKYDKILWIKALSLAEGDTEKQKGIYINLRSSQLASLNKDSTEQTAPNSSPTSKFDVSGIYISEITSDSQFILKEKYQKLQLVLRQRENEITGTSVADGVKIYGTITGDVIKFDVSSTSSKVTGGFVLYGSWRVSSDGKRLTGKWSMRRGSGGKWNLTRIE